MGIPRKGSTANSTDQSANTGPEFDNTANEPESDNTANENKSAFHSSKIQ